MLIMVDSRLEFSWMDVWTLGGDGRGRRAIHKMIKIKDKENLIKALWESHLKDVAINQGSQILL